MNEPSSRQQTDKANGIVHSTRVMNHLAAERNEFYLDSFDLQNRAVSRLLCNCRRLTRVSNNGDKSMAVCVVASTFPATARDQTPDGCQSGEMNAMTK